jgi:hypothetical protein
MFNKLREETEKVRGGLSDNMTIDKIAEKHGVGIRTIEMQIEKGKKIEMEHTDDPKEAERVAMDHLVEIPDYYDRLVKMEKEAEEENLKIVQESVLAVAIPIGIIGAIGYIKLEDWAMKIDSLNKAVKRININEKTTLNQAMQYIRKNGNKEDKSKLNEILHIVKKNIEINRYFVFNQTKTAISSSSVEEIISIYNKVKNREISKSNTMDNSKMEKEAEEELKEENLEEYLKNNAFNKTFRKKSLKKQEDAERVRELIQIKADEQNQSKKEINTLEGLTEFLQKNYDSTDISKPKVFKNIQEIKNSTNRLVGDMVIVFPIKVHSGIVGSHIAGGTVIDWIIGDLRKMGMSNINFYNAHRGNFSGDHQDSYLNTIVKSWVPGGSPKEYNEINESMILLTEDEKAIKLELQKAMDFFGGKKVEGVDTNRFIRLGNMIRDNLKMEFRVILKLLNPLNWPKAIFMNYYNIIKSIATLGTRENESLKLETRKFLRDIADGKYKGKSAKDMFTDYNEIRKEYGFKPYTFLQENVIRTDFNGEINRDFDGNVIDAELETLMEAVASAGRLKAEVRKLELKLRTEKNPSKIREMMEQLVSIRRLITEPSNTDGKTSDIKEKVKKDKA